MCTEEDSRQSVVILLSCPSSLLGCGVFIPLGPQEQVRAQIEIAAGQLKTCDMHVLHLRGECKVCYKLHVRTVFVNCGHIDFALSKEIQVGGFVLPEQSSNLNA